jgi:hypothetical protein
MLFLKSFAFLNLFFISIALLPHLGFKEKKDPAVVFLLNMVLYLFLLVIGYSCIKTGMNTVFVFIIPILLWSLYRNISHLKIRFVIGKNELVVLGKILLVVNSIFIVKSIYLYQGSGEYLKVPHGDYLFYAKVAGFLKDYGIESIHMSSLAMPTPYHYFELWLSAFFAEFGMNVYATLMLITYPIVYGFCCCLTYLLIKNNVNNKSAIIFAASILTIQLFYISQVYSEIPFLGDASIFAETAWNYQKLSVLYFMVLIALVVYRNFGINQFLIVLALFPIIYGTTIFSIAGVLCTSFLLKISINKTINWSSIFVVFLGLLFFKFYYQFNHYQNEIVPQIDFAFIKTAINIIGGTVIRIFIFVIPFILLFYVLNKEKTISLFKVHNSIVLILLSAILASLLGWSLIHLQSDAVQIFSNLSLTIVCIGLVYLLSLIDYKISLVVLISLVFFNFNKYQPYRKTTSLNEKEFLFKNRNRGVFVKNLVDYENVFNINPSFSGPFMDASIINSKITMVDLSMVDIDIAYHPYKEMIRSYKKYNDLYNFMQQTHLSGLAAKAEFIKENKIEFLICPKAYLLDPKISTLFNNKKELENSVVWYN